MDESIREFVRSVKIGSCRICRTPRLVFLCGGAVSTGSRANTYQSTRDYFYRYVTATSPDLAKRMRLAEEINDWFDEDTFEDLLQLEVYLADLCDLTVLFVESPGSIAELGAFAASRDLRPKTLAVLNSTYPSAKTFISDGPVRCIRRHDDKLVRYYEWDPDPTGLGHPSTLDALEEMSEEIADLIRVRGESRPKETKLDFSSPGKTMLLLADLVGIVGVVTATELIECLSIWGHQIDRKELRRHLVILEKLTLIEQKPHSDQIYYLSTTETPFVRLDFAPNTPIRDRERAKTLIRAALGRSDPRRMRVYEGSRRRRRAR